ncbi:MAG: hypothetical protein RLZZ467_1074, partial [Gemmatimonadota bacterium]
MATEVLAGPHGITVTEADRRAAQRRVVRRRVGTVLRYAFLTALAIVVLFPIYITVVNSLLTPSQIAAKPPVLFPTDPTWGAYGDAWNAGSMSQYLVNSVIVTALIVTGQIVTATLAAYAFAFLE